MSEVWLFYGAGARFASGAFSDQKEAMEWIEKHKLTGLLTKYPLDVGVYEWAIKNEFFSPKKEHESTPEFIQRFTCANQEHYHFEDGVLQ